MSSWKLLGTGFLLSIVPLVSQADIVRINNFEPAVQRFEKEVNQIFPAHYAKILDAPVQVEFAQLDAFPVLSNPCEPAPGVRVMARTQFSAFTGAAKVFLHSGLLPYIRKGARDNVEFKCGHKNFYKMALASVLHEVTHIYDRSSRHWTDADRAALEGCKTIYNNVGQISPMDTQCIYYLKAVGKISESPNYYNLVQFPDDHSANKNMLIQRSLDPYEMTNPIEHLAVNMEYFLLDPQYRCRRPSMYHFLAQQTGDRPFANTECKSVQYVLGSMTQNIMPMDPHRVYQVHYLFASKGKAIMSRWGHSMFRVIVCAPERKTVGPECLEDVSSHIVFSYRANIADVILRYWDGLTGKYPSQLLAFSLNEIVEDYNKDEDRDLISLPMNITEAEKNRMVERLLEQYWSYSGKYYFLTNNCAQETDQIIRGVIDPFNPYHSTMNMTPQAIYKHAALHGLIDTHLIDDRESAIEKGYFFKTERPVLEQAFREIRRYVGYQSLDEYLHRSQSQERRAILKHSRNQKMGASLYILEKQILRMTEVDLDNAMTQTILDQQKKGSHSKISTLMAKSLDLKLTSLPWKLASGGYGLPLESEMMPEEVRQQKLQTYA
jgi:hypothetical protein